MHDEHTLEVDEQQVRIKVEDSRQIYVGENAIAAIRDDAHGQAHKHLRDAWDMWDDNDSNVEDLEQMKELQFKLAMASAAVETLVMLAPVPEDDDEG